MSTNSTITVDAAQTRLFQSAQDLWKEKVTEAKGIYKIPGVISYFWNVRSVIAFNTTYSDLVNKVSKQFLVNTDHLNMSGNVGVNLSIGELEKQNLLQKQSEQALNAFYKAFKARCSKLSIGEHTPEYAIYAQAAKKALETPKPKVLDTADAACIAKISTNMKPMLVKFDNIMYKDMVATFAKQKAEDINMKSFADKSEMMSKLFELNAADVEASLRQAALNSEVGNHSDAFKNLEAEFRKTGPGSRFEAFKAEVRALRPTLEKDEARLKALDGEWYQDPKALTCISSDKLEKALNAFNVQLEKYKTSATGNISGIKPDSNIPEQCIALTARLAKEAPELDDAAQLYNTAKKEHEALLKEQTDLRKAIHDLKVRLDENNLDVEAKAEMGNQADFYKEMQVVVGPNNKAACFNQMNALLKRAVIRK